MGFIPKQGDVIWLDFDPSSGQEIMKTRPALVLSQKIFNEHTGLAIVAPITSTIRHVKLEVVLPDEMETKGSVLLHQLKSFDYVERNAKFIEKGKKEVIDQALSIARLLIS